MKYFLIILAGAFLLFCWHDFIFDSIHHDPVNRNDGLTAHRETTHLIPPGITLQTDGEKWSFLCEDGSRYPSMFASREDAIYYAWVWAGTKREEDDKNSRIWTNSK